MVKRGVHSTSSPSKGLIHQHSKHPVFRQKLSWGQRIADHVAEFGGSWTFIILFFIILLGWIAINAFILLQKPFDPYPFILLNLVLSCLAAIQAPIILMAQNRQAERDRIYARYDYQVNRKAEREIQDMQRDLDDLKFLLVRSHGKKGIVRAERRDVTQMQQDLTALTKTMNKR